MGEAYKGLTIRFAANSTALRKDMTSINSVINQTNKCLRSVHKGLRFNPESTALLASKVENLDTKLFECAQKLRMLREQESRLSSERGIDRLAQNATRLHQGFTLAKDELTKCQYEIVKWKNGISDLNDEQKDMLKNLRYGETVEKQLVEIFGEHSDRVKELVAEYEPLRQAFLRAEEAMRRFRKASDLEKTRTDINILEAEMRNVAAQSITTAKALDSVYNGRDALELAKAIERADRQLERLKADAKTISLDSGSFAFMLKSMKNTADQSKLLKQQVKDANRAIGHLKDSVRAMKANGIKDMGMTFEEAEESARNLAVEMAKVREKGRSAVLAIKAFELDPSSVTFGEKELGKLRNQAREAYDQLKRLRVEARQADDQMRFAKAREEIDNLKSKALSANAAIRTLGSSGGSISSAFSSGFASMRSFSAALSTNVTPAVMMASSYIVDSAEEFDSAYRDMRKTVDGTEQQFEALKQAAIDFSSQSIISSSEILEIEAMGGQLGIAAENLGSFAETVSNINVSSDIGAEEAAEDLGKLSNIMGLTSSEYEKFGDALIRLGNNTATMESDVMAITMRFAAVGKQSGMSADQILAWADAAGTTGLKAEAAGTAMQRTISQIEAAVAGGGEKLDAFAKVSGMSAEKFAEKWNNDASGALLAFVAGLSKMDKANESVEATLQSMGITGVRQKNLLEGLANEYGQAAEGAGEASAENNKLVDSLRMSEDAFHGVSDKWGKAGDAAREAQQKSEGFSGSLGIMRNNASNLASSVGDSLIPFMDKASEVLRNATKYWESLSEAEQENIIKMAALAAAAGPVLNMFGAAGQALVPFVKQFGKAKEAVQLLGLAMTNMVLTGPQLAIVGAGLASIVALLAMWGKHAASLRKAEKAQTAASKAYAAAKDPIIEEASALDKLKDSLGMYESNLDEITERQEQFAESITDTFNEMKTNVSMVEGYEKVIAELGSKTDRSATENERLNQAIEGMNEACGSQLAIDDATGKVYDYSNATHETVESIDGFIDKFQEQNATAEQVDKLEEAQRVIDELGGKEKLSAEDTDTLREALELVNSECGQNFKLDTATGEIQNLGEEAEMTRGKLEDLVAQMELTAKAEAYQSIASDAYEDYIRQTDEASAALERMHELESSGQAWIDKDVVNARTGQVDHIRVMTEEYKNATEAAKTAQAAQKEAYDIYEDSTDVAATAASAFDIIATSCESTSEKTKAAFEKSGVSIGDFQNALVDAGIGTEQLASVSHEQWRSILDATNGSVPDIIAALEALGDGGQAGLDAYFEKLSGQQDLVRETFANNSKAAVEGAESVDFGPAAEKNVLDYSNSLMSPGAIAIAKGAGKELPAAANSAMSDKSNSAQKAGSNTASSFASGVGSKSGEAAKAGENVSAQSAAKLGSKASAAKTHGATMGSNFSSGLLSKTPVAMSAGKSVGESAKESMNVDTTSVGYNFDQGLANGIASNGGVVASAAAALGRRTMAALEAEFDINSPSKETEKTGLFFDQGLARGITAGARAAVTAAGRLAADTINSLNKGITSASYEALQMNIEAAVRTGGVFDSMKANMVTKSDIQSAVEAAIAGKNLGSQSITQSVGNVTFNGDEQIRAVITEFVETVLMKRGM